MSSARLEAMVLGDYHHGVNLDDVREATYEMIAEFEPKNFSCMILWTDIL